MEFFTYKNTDENAKKVEEEKTKTLRARKLFFFKKKEKYDESKHDQKAKISLPVKDYE